LIALSKGDAEQQKKRFKAPVRSRIKTVIQGAADGHYYI
jgi:hypothetical protein